MSFCFFFFETANTEYGSQTSKAGPSTFSKNDQKLITQSRKLDTGCNIISNTLHSNIFFSVYKVLHINHSWEKKAGKINVFY